MEKLYVAGGRKLSGEIGVHGSKNAVLPILAAAILTDEEVVLHNCPALSDVENMRRILAHIGCRSRREGESLIIDPSGADGWELPERLAGRLRSSITMLGAMLGRFARARLALPGGCDIGLRPIDLHIKAMSGLNVAIYEDGGSIFCDARNIRGADIHLDYPSVGTTENVMMASVRAFGTTVITNAAKEPEITDLQNFLNSMGARVFGAGTGTIIIHGVSRLHGTEYTVMSDRIVAGTLLVAGAITGSRITLERVHKEHLASVIAKLREGGSTFEFGDATVTVDPPERSLSVGLVETLPYPGFPTDMQAQMTALQAVSVGTCIVVENVFENRFRYCAELRKMGANITVKNRVAVVGGVQRLQGTAVSSCDLRGGAALVLAGLIADGITTIGDVQYIDRGYYRIEDMLSALGADIRRTTETV
ncbi:MAG: UDP-N-acetylglucosamine 1-carboxyvinyltransferase [Eubacteriales bacterium]|nr:UDP-N-acetylglucosamine 1-carboxyvinyltransferase [Eubacteriales bacterium]